MKTRRILLAFLLIAAGCGKNEPKPENKPDPKPGVPVLLGPAQNEVCTTGIILSDTTSAILFTWNDVANASAYELHIRNLLNNQVVQQSTTLNSFKATLKRNTPYSWYITAKGKAGEVISDQWKFYVAGRAATSYAPFPAELLSPLQGESMYASLPIALLWRGSSVSDNIAGYDLYFGAASNPPLLASDISPFNTSYSVNVERSTTYYWRIVTKDANGNTSTSALFQFNNR